MRRETFPDFVIRLADGASALGRFRVWRSRYSGTLPQTIGHKTPSSGSRYSEHTSLVEPLAINPVLEKANLGTLDFESPLEQGRKALYEEKGFGYRLHLTFERGLAFAEEHMLQRLGMFGMNVNFAGMYRRIGNVEGPPISKLT